MTTPSEPNARAFTICNDVMYFALQSKGDTKLTEKTYCKDWSNPQYVGSARKETPMAYVVYGQGGEKRVIFCLDERNIVKSYEFDEDGEAEWVPGKLSELNTNAYPNTAFAAIYSGGLIRLYFQNELGALQELASSGLGEEWSVSQYCPAVESAMLGTSLSATETEGLLYLFYFSQKGSSIHRTVYDGKAWSDGNVEDTKDAMPHGRLNAMVRDGIVKVSFINLKSEVFEASCERGQTRIKVGEVAENGHFKPETTKECGWFGSMNFGFPTFIYSSTFMTCWVCGGVRWASPGSIGVVPCSCGPVVGQGSVQSPPAQLQRPAQPPVEVPR